MMLAKRANELMKKMPISRIDQLLALPPTALVRLYSYQSSGAWLAAIARKYWTGSEVAIKERGDYQFKQAYEWMRERMAERIPDFSGDYPMWAWVKRPSTKPKETRYMGTGGDVRLTVLVPRSRIVFSDYETWHSVLNSGSIHRTEQEHDDWSELHWRTDDEHYQTDDCLAMCKTTWPACLEFEPAVTQAEMAWGISKKYFRLQACIDRFYWNEIESVRIFPHTRMVPGMVDRSK